MNGEEQDLQKHKEKQNESNGISESVDITKSASNNSSLIPNLKDTSIINARTIELQNVLERQSKELAEARLRLNDMQSK